MMEYRAWRIGLPKPAVSRQTMFRDHQLNKNNVGRDIRLILSLQPQTGDDFVSCTAAYQRENRDAIGKTLSEAVKNKVIYEITSYHAEDYESFDMLLVDSMVVTVADIVWPERLRWPYAYYNGKSQTDTARMAEAKQQAFKNILLPLLNDSTAHLNLRVLPPHIYYSFGDSWLLLHGPDIVRPSSDNAPRIQRVITRVF
jgi:hypothetical protein